MPVAQYLDRVDWCGKPHLDPGQAHFLLAGDTGQDRWRKGAEEQLVVLSPSQLCWAMTPFQASAALISLA